MIKKNYISLLYILFIKKNTYIKCITTYDRHIIIIILCPFFMYKRGFTPTQTQLLTLIIRCKNPFTEI